MKQGNYKRIGCTYTMVVPMNISSYREVGNLPNYISERGRAEANKTPFESKKK